ncbi:hypothetical protein [Synechococcus sp. PCC 6312]|uniref:hypothetical protein n=1 Tax=Synechococcus sp. (strain ATCC 27167 / PCC 6312) TaxID=195253 RepID=UPI00029F0BB2|nr:hypothetical protein [Synechococcus sp. PCC 6312]AFY61179.1 hypothetical protein Syn6312_2048 [Synechococcus sp. PCC 6312]
MQRTIPGLVAILLFTLPGLAQTSQPQTVTSYGATEFDARNALMSQIQGLGQMAGGIYCEPMYRLDDRNQQVIWQYQCRGTVWQQKKQI